MKKIYLKVREEDLHKIRGIPLRLFPDEMDDCFEFRNKEFENILSKIHLKMEQESENRLKAMMWFHQDYNPKHYSFTVHPSNIIHGDNISRFEISRTLEYHPPKRNGHRRKHAPSEIYKDIAFKLMAKDMIESDPMYKVTQIPLSKEYLKVKEELFGKFFPLPTDKLV